MFQFNNGLNSNVNTGITELTPNTPTSGFTNRYLLSIDNSGKLVTSIPTGYYAPIDSPPLEGVPTAPTASKGTNTSQLATTAFVQNALSGITGGGVVSVNGVDGVVVLDAADVGADAAGTAASMMATHLLGATFTGDLQAPKLLVPPQVTGTTNPLVIRANTGGLFTEPAFFIGQQGSETSNGIAVRSNGAIQLLGGASIGKYNDIQLGGAGTAAFGLARGTAQNFNLGGLGEFTFDAGSGSGNTSYSVYHTAKSSTTAGQTVGVTRYSFSVGTHAIRRGQVERFVGSYGANARTSREYSDGVRGYTALTVHTTAPADDDLQASEWSVYTDGSALFAKLKNASSTVYTIPLAGSGGSGGSTFSGPINYPVVADVSSASGYSPYYDSRTFPAIIGDGTTDDAAAVRSAIATIAAAGGGTLYMAPVRSSGVNAAYKFGSAIGVIPPNVSIKGPFETSALGIGNRFYGTDGSTTLDDTFLTDPATIPGVWLIYADSGTTTNSFMKP